MKLDNQQPLQYDVRINSVRTSGSIRATASVNINGQFAVRGVKIMEGSNGIFVSMPGYKGADSKYYDTAFPCTKESKTEFDRAVLSEFQQELARLQAQSAECSEPGQQSGYGGMAMQ